MRFLELVADPAQRLTTLPAIPTSASRARRVQPLRANCRRKFEHFGGRVDVVVTDFDSLNFADDSFDAIYDSN